MCEQMKWAHLPVAGGLYDQHPDFLDGIMVVFAARNQYESDEAKKREREAKSKSRTSSVAGRRR